MTDNHKKVGIVIQGPLVSMGRTGKTRGIRSHEIREEHVVEYDCVPLLKQYIESYESEYEIVIVTWNTEDAKKLKELENMATHAQIEAIEDTTPRKERRGKIIPGNNKYRQSYSTLHGIKQLKKKGCTHAIKIRTDQKVPVKKIIDDMNTLEEEINTRIIVSVLKSYSPTSLQDFYFASKIENIEYLMESHLTHKEMFEGGQKELFLIWAKKVIGKPVMPGYYKTNPESIIYKRYIKRAWDKCFIPGKLSTYQDIIWRGERLTRFDRTSMVFMEDINDDLSVPCEKFKDVSIRNDLGYLKRLARRIKKQLEYKNVRS